ncbi:DUF2000 domain-containing protein [Mitsuaria sp. GD03876]|uniref:DUF2000 domain-containing protein n=1 Tax=Mitsuaria sp. GD03876 TaxID=2975399 RepID=UPI00244A75BE|nr:DUF2000 domain-containing protein [Mitsuaria sp. GD03876]MDH0862980.1 DUF2000 domain-containing protein [Mitsuaria sp. GD03876]
MFDTKVALIVRSDLATWQRLNVVAFLATGVASSAPEAIGEPYIDAAGRRFPGLLVQPMLVFEGNLDGLRAAHREGLDRGLTLVPYVHAMFSTGNDADNRRVFLAGDADHPDLVGLALRGPKKAVDKAVKGLTLHR